MKLAPMNLVSGLVFASTLVLASSPGKAATTSGIKDWTIDQDYLSTRALGMGNAFTAVADDYNTLFYNPAGLAHLEEGEINMGIQGLADSKFLKLQDDIKKTSDGPDSTKGQDMNNLLESNYGNHYSARPTIGAFWVRPKWGIALIPLDFDMELEVRKLGIATLNVIAIQDSTLAYGRGWDVNWFRNTRVSLGFTTKAVYRVAYINAISGPDLAFDNKVFRPEDAQEGMTVDADVAMLFSPKRELGTGWARLFHPSLALVGRNLGDYGYFSNYHAIGKDTGGSPPKLGRRFDVGTMWQIPDWWVFQTHITADLRDMGHENWTFMKGMHVGVESKWKLATWWQGAWRVGVNQGYFTAGFTGEVGMFKLDLATYAEEVGPSVEPKASRRYVAKASLDW